MRHSYVPAPFSIFRHVRKLMPGTFLTVPANGVPAVEKPYWSLADVAADGIARPDPRPVEAQAAALDTLICNTVEDCMVSDVPLGIFLSGGIDSSLVTAAMVRAGGQVRSFSLGFPAAGFDEAPYAAAIARHLGTDHTEFYVDGQTALDAVPEMASVYDEPFADSSQIPTWLISRLARRDVTVALTGDGGDELFAGYRRYWSTNRMWRLLASVPLPVRRLAARFVGLVPEPVFASIVARLTDSSPGPRRRLDSRRTAAEVLAAPDREALFRRVVSHWNDPADIVPIAESRSLLWGGALGERFGDFSQWMQVMDGLTYLPDDILVKVDRAAMSVSLETRAPLLDPRIAEAAWRLPQAEKLGAGSGKLMLRRILARHVPPALFERPKTGFGVPLADWLRGPLREWAEALLDPARLHADGLLNSDAVTALKDAHMTGLADHGARLWNVLMLHGWLDNRHRRTSDA